MIVGEDVALAVHDEAGTQALLRHLAIEEIKLHGAGRHAHHRRQHPAIDADVVLLIVVEVLRCGRFSELDMRGAGDPTADLRCRLKAAVGGEEIETGYDGNSQNKNARKLIHSKPNLVAVCSMAKRANSP